MQLPPDATGTVARTTANTYRNDEYRPYLPKQDPYQINRLVGFFEYSQALERLDTLIKMAAPEELAVIDELVKSEPEFIVYTNLARRFDQGRSTLADAPERAGDDFARRGIRWVTALARVELAAMLAGFTEHPQPFAALVGDGYDATEYRELIVDGARMHFYSLHGDPAVKPLFQTFQPNSTTLAYVRRLNVANAFVLAAATLGGFQPNSPQLAELFEFNQRLSKARAALQAQIELYLTTATSRQKSLTGSVTRVDLVEMCWSGVCRKFADAPGAKQGP